MRNVQWVVAILVVLSWASRMLEAQDIPSAPPECLDPQLVFACQGEAVLSQAGIDGAFSRVPEKERLTFIRDGAKADQLVKGLLRVEVVALDAEKAGFASEADVQQRVLLAARKELAEAWMEELMNRAPEADYAAMAFEGYLANPDAYAIPATVDVTHILISTKSRTSGEAEALAVELRGRLAEDPAQFDTLRMEFSNDRGKDGSGGGYTGVKRGQMVKPFEDTAFAMQTVGEISQPVVSEYGFHLIRLDGKTAAVPQTYEQVKDQLIEQLKVKHLEDYRTNYLQKLLQYPVVFPEGSVEVMARRYFGEDLEKAPIFGEDGPQ